MSEGKTLAVGVDLCGIGRMERAIANPRFLERVFTEAERGRIGERKGRAAAERAAASFAAQEAAAKALGTGFSGGVMPGQIGVVYGTEGRPALRLSGAAEEKMRALGGQSILISLSHDGDLAAAFAVLVGQ